MKSLDAYVRRRIFFVSERSLYMESPTCEKVVSVLNIVREITLDSSSSNRFKSNITSALQVSRQDYINEVHEDIAKTITPLSGVD